MHTLHSNAPTPSTGAAQSISSSLLAYLSALGGAAVTSHVVFNHQPPAHPEDVAVYLATLSATVIAGWWFTNVLAWFAALRRGVQLNRFTLPGAKRIAQFMLAATLSTSCIADATNDPVMVLVEQGDSVETAATTPPTSVTPTSTPPTTAVLRTTAPTTEPATVPSTTDEAPITTVTEPTVAHRHQVADHQLMVSEGDNLWSLSADTLTMNGVESPTTGQIAEYWRLVVAANQVRSGNPNLIAIGEAITMPAFDLGPFEPGRASLPSQPSQTGGIAVR